MVKVKVCGITNYKDAEAACRYGADAIGFVFAKSPRKVSPSTVKAITRRLPPYIMRVGVFADEKKEKVLKTARQCRLDCLQLHGSETINYCKELKKYYKIIKAVRIKDRNSIARLGKYDVDAFLLDSYVKGQGGGTGAKFDWRIAVAAKKADRPVILSGGLNAGNVSEAIKKVRPYAVDASSGLESAPGKKDRGLMKRFIERAKKTA